MRSTIASPSPVPLVERARSRRVNGCSMFSDSPAGIPGPRSSTSITARPFSGRVLETHPVPANRPTNCCFGGPDLTTLFVTTVEGHFFKAQTNRVGWAMYP